MIDLPELADWHGWKTADMVAEANAISGFYDEVLWYVDPDLATEASDLVDVASMLDLGGCLDANHAG